MGIADEESTALVAEFSGKLTALGTPKATVLKLLGDPDRSEPDAIAYDLGVRPDYRFCFRFVGDRLVEAGYTRNEPRALLPPNVDGRGPTRDELVALGATADELLAWLGRPAQRDGWWPVETWSYDDSLVLELRLGVVE